MAKKIMAARPIKSVSDLTAATGIKDKQFDKFKDLVTVGGINSAATPQQLLKKRHLLRQRHLFL